MAQLAASVDPGFDGCDGMILNRRYMIVVSAPLKAFDTPTARAFPVEDLDGAEGVSAGAPMLFARLNHTGLPSRDWEIDVLRELRHPHLMALIDSGEIEFEAPGQAARAMVLEYPQGGRLMAPEGAAPMPLREVRSRVIAPLCGVLKALHKHDIFHRAIHPDNLFIRRISGVEVILGDCVSSAAGHNLPSAFQPLERASAAPLGCGAGDSAADIFSFGVTVAALLAGRIPGADSDPDALLDARMEQGSLAALCGPFNFPRKIDRFLAGVLADDPDDRWTLAQIQDWLTGHRVNLAADRGLDMPQRTFSFADRKIRNPIAVAEAFHRNRAEAITAVHGGQLEKWLAGDRHRLAAAETVIALRESNASGSNKLTDDALLCRVCMVLDPKGPIRFKGMAVSIDAIGVLLAYAFIEERQDIADNIAALLDQGLPAAWIATINQRRKEMAGETSSFLRLRQYIRNPKLSHGLERCLYEMNRSFGCLHPLLAISDDAATLLAGLDEQCSPGDEEPPWTDRHVVAYLATRLHPEGDGLVASMTIPGKPQAVETMIGLGLVALAQEKLGVPLLPGMTRTAGSRLFEIVESYHSETRRAALLSALERQLDKGDFTALLRLLNNDELQEQDRRDYDQARNSYRRIAVEIAGLQRGSAGHRAKAALMGRKFAAWTAFFGFLAVSFVTLAGLAV
ncbi:MAG: hypothetical protein IIC08_02175 [Proteobacteria bacterium]|nr:hypothetical protein [Pseudomonadota bacterium]